MMSNEETPNRVPSGSHLGSTESDVTREGLRLIDRWQRAQKDLKRARRELASAECELANATNALGKWLTPKDARNDELFCVWHGDSLIQAQRKPGSMGFEVKVRSRGESLSGFVR